MASEQKKSRKSGKKESTESSESFSEKLSPKEVESIAQIMDEGNEKKKHADRRSGREEKIEERAPSISKAEFMQLQSAEEITEKMRDIQVMYDVKVHVEVVLGSVKKTLKEILSLGTGSIVELNKLSGEPVEILVNGKLIAHAEIVAVDNNFGIKIVEIIGLKKAI